MFNALRPKRLVSAYADAVTSLCNENIICKEIETAVAGLNPYISVTTDAIFYNLNMERDRLSLKQMASELASLKDQVNKFAEQNPKSDDQFDLRTLVSLSDQLRDALNKNGGGKDLSHLVDRIEKFAEKLSLQ